MYSIYKRERLGWVGRESVHGNKERNRDNESELQAFKKDINEKGMGRI